MVEENSLIEYLENDKKMINEVKLMIARSAILDYQQRYWTFDQNEIGYLLCDHMSDENEKNQDFEESDVSTQTLTRC